jgi:glycosyltransferase involved in cell wall biosynthesis
MTSPTVSIAIPLYNKASFIAETMKSVLAQTFADFEIVVVDDGSTDGGADTLRQFTDARLRVIRQPNGGVSTARTRAMREGCGRYVAFLDADDIWHPDHLRHLMELARQYPDAALLGNAFAEQRRAGAPSAMSSDGPVRYRLVENFFAECADGRTPFYTSSCMVKRDRAIELGGFPVGNYCGEDLALWILLAADAPVAASDFVGCYYRRGIDSLSLSHAYRNATNITMITLSDVLERHPAWPEERKTAVREYYFRLALAHTLDALRVGEMPLAKHYLKLASGTRALRRRLWLARLMAYIGPLRSLVFYLSDLKRA